MNIGDYLNVAEDHLAIALEHLGYAFRDSKDCPDRLFRNNLDDTQNGVRRNLAKLKELIERYYNSHKPQA